MPEQIPLMVDAATQELRQFTSDETIPRGQLLSALQVALTGLVTSDVSGVLASDTILQALGKLQAQTSNKVDKVAGKQLSTEDFTSVERLKLANIAEQATKNAADDELRDRSTHTGTQPITTISGLEAQTSAGVVAAIAMAQTFAAVPTTFQAMVIVVTQPHMRLMQWSGTKYVRSPLGPMPGVYFYAHDPLAKITHGIQVRTDVTYNTADHPDLAEYLGVVGSTFVLPGDGRARVLRGADLGVGVDATLVDGSMQGDAGRNLTGFAYMTSDGNAGGIQMNAFSGGAFAPMAPGVPGGSTPSVTTSITNRGFNLDASRQWPVADEFRVKSLVARLYMTR